MSRNGDIFLALKARLETIQTSAGYENDVKTVVTGRAKMTLNMAEADLPYIEAIKEKELFEHEASSSLWSNLYMILFIVLPNSWDDVQMESVLSDIRKCLFGGAADASGNTGINLGGTISSMHLIDSTSDLGMVDSNRFCDIRIRLRSHRTTYRD